MKDIFKNFYGSGRTANTEIILIPESGASIRDLATTEEVHDFIISATSLGSSINPNWKAVVDVYIKDRDIIHNVTTNYLLYSYLILKDGKSYHNEKSFTIRSNQSLVYKIREITSSGSGSNYNVNASTSCIEMKDDLAEFCVFTINPTPLDANVIIRYGDNISTSNTIKVPKGAVISYEVSKNHYITQSDTNIQVSQDTELNVSLVKMKYLRINTNAENATITLSATGYTQEGDLIYVPAGTSVNWSVTAPHYIGQNGTQVVNSDTTKQVTLALETHTFTINPIPSNATVTLTANGSTQSGNSITVPYGTTVSWKVSASGYIDQSGTYKVLSNSSKNVVLEMKINATVFESNLPTTTQVYLTPGIYEITVVGGSGGSSSSGGGGGGSYVSGTKEAIGGS